MKKEDEQKEDEDEDDFYKEDSRDALVEDDELSPAEAGFMQGYDQGIKE